MDLVLDDIRELPIFFLGEILEVIQENVHINWNRRLNYLRVKRVSPNTCSLLSKSSVKKIHMPVYRENEYGKILALAKSGWWMGGCILYSSFNFCMF